jgi:hypothetical protein
VNLQFLPKEKKGCKEKEFSGKSAGDQAAQAQGILPADPVRSVGRRSLVNAKELLKPEVSEKGMQNFQQNTAVVALAAECHKSSEGRKASISKIISFVA